MKILTTLFLSVAFVIGMILPNIAQAGIQENTYYYSVLFNENKIPSDFSTRLASCGGEITDIVPEIGFAQVKGGKSTFSELHSLSSVKLVSPSITWSIPRVKGIEVDSDLAVDNERSSIWELQWDIQRVTENAASYHLGTGSHNVVVGIIDSGIYRMTILKNTMTGNYI